MSVAQDWTSIRKIITACLIVLGPDGKPKKEVRTFGTMTEDILELSERKQRARRND